jgi:hypothetical protein
LTATRLYHAPVAKWLASLEVVVLGADNIAIEVVPPVEPDVFHPFAPLTIVGATGSPDNPIAVI